MLRGDLLDAIRHVERADVVTMDRVVCCYPLYAELLREALQRATRTFAFSYPRDRWYVRAAVWVENAARRRRTSGFRTFVHPQGSMHALIEHAGFERVAHAQTIAWAADVFARRA
jgi:magnesium-protoporphyrin O-methyltransferase